MILQKLQDLLRQHQVIALKELSDWLQAEPDALRGMLAHLQERGLAEPLPAGTPCSGCDLCPTDSIELWKWTGEPLSPQQRVQIKPQS